MTRTHAALTVLFLAACAAAAAEPGVGFLRAAADETAGEAAARALCADTLGGSVVEATGGLELPDDFRALWWHCEHVPLPAAMTSEAARRSILSWVEQGHGLFLTGAALQYASILGIESTSPRVGATGTEDSVQVGVDPSTAPDHPIYRGFDASRPVMLCSGGFPPFSDFWGSGGPANGTVIGRAVPDSGENPLVEYAYGRGRIVAMGWRLPHYGFTANAYADNLRQLTRNALTYLAAGEWHGHVPDSRYMPALSALRGLDPEALTLAIQDLTESFPDEYPGGERYLEAARRLAEVRAAIEAGDTGALDEVDGLRATLREAMLANPLLRFGKLLLVKRGESQLGLPQNWESNSSIPSTGYDNELDVLSPVSPDGELTTLLRPDGGRFIGDVDLDFDASRMLFSMPGANGRWQVHEMGPDGSGLRELPLVAEPDVDNYDACYLPDGNVMFTSTAPFVGVPCVTGSSHVSNLYRYDRETGAIRRLSFGQDHDWCPTMLPDGRLLYLRWEYSDLPHFVSRILFTMNPDGTNQAAYYGSNSYWPNAMFYARPLPGDPSKFVAVVGGHHDNPRMGELVLFDSSKGRFEADGALQRIPGRGRKVEPVLLDGLTLRSWPKFLHPFPLSDKYIVVSCKPTPASSWGLYLVDVFDNMTLIKEVPGYALLEPVPLQATPRPPVLQPRVQPDRRDATVYIADIYVGNGLRGVPRGAVKRLRLFTYHFAYHGVGGQVHRVGFDGPWDVKRIIGTVPVEPDGSALFTVPANTPISMQPLDGQGQALQLMRSWMTAMPGESVSCVGCHEQQDTTPPSAPTLASTREPSEIAPWYGPTRGFSFDHEVQPVLDRYCVSCHGGLQEPDLRRQPPVHLQALDGTYNAHACFTPSYLALRYLVRGHTQEGDMHLLEPGEFAADTTRLVQMLRRGHRGVTLGTEAWDRLTTWIDLNTPAYGYWHEILGDEYVRAQRERRREMQRKYDGLDEDPEAEVEATVALADTPAQPPAPEPAPEAVACPGWPLGTDAARRRQQGLGQIERAVDLGGGLSLSLRLVPSGEYVMGDPDGYPNELPMRRVSIDKPLWVGALEVTNEQFRRFRPGHTSRLETGDFLHFGIPERGWSLDEPAQPVVHVSWNDAAAFCEWLSGLAGERFRLPTQEEWEWACRAGSASPLWFGATNADFAPYANLADISLRRVETHSPWGLPSGAIPEWRPAVTTVDDRYRVSAPVGRYEPNAWGLYDMHGNASEWTSSDLGGEKVVRGGSWYDLPRNARSSARISYPPYCGVYDVGFRIVADP